MTLSIRLATFVVPFAWAATASMARAQVSCARAASGAATTTTREWPAPLDRRITLHEREVSLRDALDRLAAAARVRLAYSADLLPLDRRVCAVYRSVAVGTALTELLEGITFRDALFLTWGVRFEHSAGTSDVDRNSTLPMFGAAFVQDVGRAAVKFRVAYGKGIRAAETTIRTTSWMGVRGSERGSNLAPEEQSGVEAGVDLLIGAGRSASTLPGSIRLRPDSSSRSR